MSLVMVSAADLWAHAGGRGFSVRGALVMLADRLLSACDRGKLFQAVCLLFVCLLAVSRPFYAHHAKATGHL